MSPAGSVQAKRSPWQLARQVATATAVGVGVTAVGTAATTGLLVAQARQARRVIPMAEAPPPRGDGIYGAKFPGEPITMVVLGDSSAAGYGVHRPRETPGALLATGTSRRLRRPVRLYRYAVVGCLSAGLRPQVDAALERNPDVAVILIGGNDVTNRTPPAVAVRFLVDAVHRLRAAGAEVVVGTCPDLGAIQPIKPPLRWLARRWSRQLAAAQTVAVVEAGGWTVSLGDLLGPRFAAEPTRMFAWDHFHPSAEGYAIAAAAILPTVLAALGAGPERRAAQVGDHGVRSLPKAAHEAARHAGTEVRGVRVGGRDHGPGGRWAQLRRRGHWFGHPRSTAVAAGPVGATATGPAAESGVPDPTAATVTLETTTGTAVPGTAADSATTPAPGGTPLRDGTATVNGTTSRDGATARDATTTSTVEELA